MNRGRVPGIGRMDHSELRGMFPLVPEGVIELVRIYQDPSC